MPSPTFARVNRDQPAVALLVDHDADTRKMYAGYLKLSSCIIEEADDGRDALAKALAYQPDIIVTETRLPGISGFDLCSLLRRDTITSSIPIVVVTADAFAANVRRAEIAGADAVLVKPCRPETLVAEMSRLLDQSSLLRERARAVREEEHGQDTADDRHNGLRVASRRPMLSHSHARHDTTTPPSTPPALLCPSCDRPLRYVRSHIGGVSVRHAEQWDYFDCPGGCGTFEYRERTRKLRKP